jgi:diguanylate cyclase (GGDEF)-like protein
VLGSRSPTGGSFQGRHSAGRTGDRELLTGGRNASTGINRNQRKDGSIIWCEWHNSALRDERGNVLSILSFAQDVSDRVDAQAKLEAMATHDALTGLPNRVLLHRRLTDVVSRARHRQRQVAILFIDLDRFKNVNDSLGHRIGDELLKLISRRLALALRKGDFLARLGGDEFTVLLENMTETEGARQVATKLLDVIEQPYWVHGHLVHVSASIGLALFPDDGDDPDTLLKNADVAMYRAKEAGKNVYQFFAQEMGAHQQEKMALENALRQAVKTGALSIALQPKVEVRSGRIVGAEALARWHDAVLGDVGPSRFIPVAEEAGLIDVIGDSVLTQACRELQTWTTAGLPSMTVAVNLSVRQFRDPAMSSRIERIFAQTGVDPRLVEFEVTESSVLYDAETVSRVLQIERELGVRVAIDDFGTGYSSLVHLKHLPIDTLKIDSRSSATSRPIPTTRRSPPRSSRWRTLAGTGGRRRRRRDGGAARVPHRVRLRLLPGQLLQRTAARRSSSWRSSASGWRGLSRLEPACGPTP